MDEAPWGGSLRGRLLIATPPLVDPNFDRTVVLLLEHGDEGALGLVLNRPSATDIGEALPFWRGLASSPPVVFAGGPVSPEAVIALARGESAEESEGWAPFLDRLGTVDLSRDPDDLDTRIEVVRVFAGYAGWGPAQLEGELDHGAWFVVTAEPGDPFSDDPEHLWKAVLRRQRGRVAWFANCPADVSTN